MPGGNFDASLNVTGAQVVTAGGPLDPSVTQVLSLCVWVLQRPSASTDDAIAQAMGPEHEHMPGMTMGHGAVTVTGKGTPEAHWEMQLGNREGTEAVNFVNGAAMAAAIGAFLINGQQRRGFFWSEPVELKLASAAAS